MVWKPNLGSFYDKKEINAVIRVLEKSRHWSMGLDQIYRVKNLVILQNIVEQNMQ